MKNKAQIYGVVGLLVGGAIAAAGITQVMKMGHQDMSRMHSDPHAGHNMAGDDPHAGHNMNHHSMPKTEAVQAKLTVPPNVSPNKPVPLVIDIQDKSGKAIAKFDNFQEKLMHLIVVSDDFQVFNHIHPTYKQNGRFEVNASFPQSGNYSLFSDYKPTGQKEQVSVLKAQVAGKITSPAPTVDLNSAKTFGDTKVNLTFSKPKIKAGEDVTLQFNLQNAADNQPIKDLQPYLGEKGHLVILRQSPNLTAADYIHAHAMNNTPPEQVSFHTQFPQPGKYKVWGQFNRGGKVVTADFWVEVI
ncbi:hypothetical protein H6F61_16615 [Cyanobacteria bacterium FACHB-472]|nr:hypothetical protein [Cyanobacteria bacterium FACHB-472]